MKKLWIGTLSLILVLSFSACKVQQPPAETPAPTIGATETPGDQSAAPSADVPQTGETDASLSGLLEQVYQKTETLELSLAPTAAVDLGDANAVKTFLGLDDVSGVTEAVVSEPLMSSSAYSVCLMRTAADADSAAVMRAAVNGVDPRKWICVEAESVSAVCCGDVIFLVMTEQALSDDLMQAFGQVMGDSAVSAPVVRGK